MSTETNKAIILRYLDDIRADKNPTTLDTYIAEDDLKQHIAFFEGVFPGYYLDPHDVIAEGDRVFVRATIRGVHKGEFMGLAPTGREVNVPLFIVYRLEGGKIAEHWMLADMPALMQQLGAAQEAMA
jgi:predicted ester cyclase